MLSATVCTPFRAAPRAAAVLFCAPRLSRWMALRATHVRFGHENGSAYRALISLLITIEAPITEAIRCAGPSVRRRLHSLQRLHSLLQSSLRNTKTQQLHATPISPNYSNHIEATARIGGVPCGGLGAGAVHWRQLPPAPAPSIGAGCPLLTCCSLLTC